MTADAVAGLVLAAGQGRRMRADGDPTPKPLRRFGDRTLVEHVIERLRPQVDTLLLNPPDDGSRWRALGLRCVPDDAHAGCGPLAGLLAGLRASPHRWVAVVPCDTPHLPADLVARLHAARAARPECRIAVARTDDGLQPLCALVDAALADDLDAWLAAGGRRAGDWMARHAPAVAAFDDPRAFANANAPGDLQALASAIARPAGSPPAPGCGERLRSGEAR